jgi:hypothetical protein
MDMLLIRFNLLLISSIETPEPFHCIVFSHHVPKIMKF